MSFETPTISEAVHEWALYHSVPKKAERRLTKPTFLFNLFSEWMQTRYAIDPDTLQEVPLSELFEGLPMRTFSTALRKLIENGDLLRWEMITVRSSHRYGLKQEIWDQCKRLAA